MLVLKIYKETKSFPSEEKFGLISQLRRAAVSITSNVAEGFRRYSPKDKGNFYQIAFGSLTEIQNQLLIARDINYISKEQFDSIAHDTIELSKLMIGLIKATKNMHKT